MRPEPEVCDLCGLPLPGEAVTVARVGGLWRFCCDSCRQIHLMLTGEEMPAGGAAAQPEEVRDA